MKTDFGNTKSEPVILGTVTLTLLRSTEESNNSYFQTRFKIHIVCYCLIFHCLAVKYKTVIYNVLDSDVDQHKNKLVGKNPHFSGASDLISH